MSVEDFQNAQNQLSALSSFIYVERNLVSPPISMPQDRLRSAGLHPEVWSGLGIVGVWSALDAYLERSTGKRGSLVTRCVHRLSKAELDVLKELEDLRNLFAHNFAGKPDRTYLTDTRRHCLNEKRPYLLACGRQFTGEPDEPLPLSLEDLIFYVEQAKTILSSLT